jgi:hypothetical protein
MVFRCLAYQLQLKKDAPMRRAKTKVYRVVRKNLNVQVYDILKEMIADRRFAPGSSLTICAGQLVKCRKTDPGAWGQSHTDLGGISQARAGRNCCPYTA